MLRNEHYALPRARLPISRGTIPARGKGYLQASIMLQRRKRAHETFTCLCLGDTDGAAECEQLRHAPFGLKTYFLPENLDWVLRKRSMNEVARSKSRISFA